MMNRHEQVVLVAVFYLRCLLHTCLINEVNFATLRKFVADVRLAVGKVILTQSAILSSSTQTPIQNKKNKHKSKSATMPSQQSGFSSYVLMMANGE